MRQDDEHAAFERPTGRSKPRTKTRPNYDNAATGTVTTIDRGRYGLRCEQRDINAVKARTLGRRSVVVGDQVRMVGDVSGNSDALARIVKVENRRSELRRTADDDDPYERVIIANADQMVVVAALADPPPRIGLIDRCLAAAYSAEITPLVVLTKADLADPTPVLRQLEPVGVRALAIGHEHSIDDITATLQNRTSVLIGHSGVGKSTLMNRLVPQSQRAVGSVNETSRRGRHTSTSARGFELDGGGWVFDTPGIRSFGLAHVSVNDIVASFQDLAPITAQCPRGCTHHESATECELDKAIGNALISQSRVEGLRRLLAGREMRS